MPQCLHDERGGCRRCDAPLDFDFTMAFQPILDLVTGQPFAFEALVRGVGGEGAETILAQVRRSALYRFDQQCRIHALQLAHRLNCQYPVSINFLPEAVYEPRACIQATLAVAARLGWPASRIMFEITETEYVRDRAHLQRIVDDYNAMDFATAIDDFGAGFANLELLVDLRPDIVKIDRHLICGIHASARRQAILTSLVSMAEALGIRLIAEGVETLDEARWLLSRGITLQQGYYYAHPAIEALPLCPAERLEAVWAGAHAATSAAGGQRPQARI